MARWLIVTAVRLVFNLISNLKIYGRENLVFSGPTIVVANHLGRLDALLILTLKEFTSHPNLIVVVAEKYREYAIYRWAVDVMNFLWLDRFNGDVGTVREVLRRLKSNGLMVIAPEGTRSPTESLMKAKSGAAYLASRSGATIIPVGVIGTEDKKVRSLLGSRRKVEITMRIGKPFKAPPLPGSDRERFLDETTDLLMCQIAALLPESYRGYYRSHPLVQSLVSGV